jgi:hypothetical protein
MSDLAELLNRVSEFVRSYVVLSDDQLAATSLWTLHTWAFEAADCTPYLRITSAEKESGKTRLLEVLSLIVREPIETANVTDSALFRLIGGDITPTILFDEVDTIFGKDARERRELQGLLNAGYRRGANAIRMVGEGSKMQPKSFPVFAPKALAGLSTGQLPDTLVSRSITLGLKRKLASEPVERFRRKEAESAADSLKEAARSLADHHVERLTESRPNLPDELGDRAQDVWEPLLALADLAGGEWPSKARRAAVVLSARDDEESRGVQLLRDTRTIFDARPSADRIATADYLESLAPFEESPWGGWWWDSNEGRPRPGAAHKLARMLRPFDIAPQNLNMGDGRVVKGYYRSSFTDAWARFLPEPLSEEESLPDKPHEQGQIADVAEIAPPGEGGGADDDVDPRLYCSRTCPQRGCWKPNGDGWEVGCLAAEEEATA